MKKEFKIYKQDNQFYVLKNGIKLPLKMLCIQDLLLVSVVNRIRNFGDLIDDDQKIDSYTDLKAALGFYENAKGKISENRILKAIHALDAKNLLSRVEEFAQMGNITPLEIAQKFSMTENKAREK